MNNKDLRTLAERITKAVAAIRPSDAWTIASEREIVMAEGVLRLLDEVERLSDLLADEILEGSKELAAEIRELDVDQPASDVPEGFQEVDVDDLLSNGQ